MVKYELLDPKKPRAGAWFNKLLEILKPESAEQLNGLLRPLFEEAFFALGEDAPKYE